MQQWWEKLQNLFTGRPAGADGNPDGPDALLKVEPKDPLGRKGENHAAVFLRRQGFKILTRNYLTPVGEIDIIARDRDTLVFCEVKTRLYDEPAPEEQVNAAKMHQMTKAAKVYLGRYPKPHPPARFDVVAIVWPQGQQPTIRHIPHAFEPTF